MKITKADVADLREGDVVELTFDSGSVIRGPLTSEEHYAPGLGIASAGWSVRDREGEPGWGITQEQATLTVVSRAPRPLYVNHPRTEAVPGDVVRSLDENSKTVWIHADEGTDTPWLSQDHHGTFRVNRAAMPTRLRLLVDGTTGQVVQ